MAAAVEAQNARPVTGRVGAAAAGHLREHVHGGGLELRGEAAVALDVAARQLGRVGATGVLEPYLSQGRLGALHTKQHRALTQNIQLYSWARARGQ